MFDLNSWYYIGHPFNLFEISERCRHADHDLVPWLKTKGIIKRFWHNPTTKRIRDSFLELDEYNQPIVDFNIKERVHIHLKLLPEKTDVITIVPLTRVIGARWTTDIYKELLYFNDNWVYEDMFVTTCDCSKRLKIGYQLVDGLIDGFYLEV